MTQSELIGLVFVLLFSLAALWVIYKIIKWFIHTLLAPVRAFKAYRLRKLEPAIKGIGIIVFLNTIRPMGQDIKGKKFASLDFTALKEKHRYPGHDDEANFFNAVFFKEVDEVVESIKKGETTNLSYVSNSWVGSDLAQGVECVENAARDFIKSNENTYSYSWIKELGERYLETTKRALAEQAADNALNGEYEEPEELEEPESESYDDSPVVNNYYVAGASTPTTEKRKDFPTRSKQHGFEIWRYYGSSPLKIGERLSQSQAVQFAQQKCNDRTQPYGSSFVVREKDSGATVFSGQRVK